MTLGYHADQLPAGNQGVLLNPSAASRSSSIDNLKHLSMLSSFRCRNQKHLIDTLLSLFITFKHTGYIGMYQFLAVLAVVLAVMAWWKRATARKIQTLHSRKDYNEIAKYEQKKNTTENTLLPSSHILMCLSCKDFCARESSLLSGITGSTLPFTERSPPPLSLGYTITAGTSKRQQRRECVTLISSCGR